jgi:carboxylesterase type B
MMLYDGDNTYNGQALFRAAIMDSGSITPTDTVDCPKGQVVYDTVVAAAGCSSASDTLECLRGLEYETYLDAANSVPGVLSYTSLALSYLPRPDGTVLTASPEVLIAEGKYAAVPMIIGDQENEGTLFALFQSNLTDTTDIVDYLMDVFFPDATEAQMQELVATYSGEALDTSALDSFFLYSEYTRLAVMLGDLVFNLARRSFLYTATEVNPDVPAWSYLASYDDDTPILGTFHASDLLQVFFGVLPNYASNAIQTYYINFLYNLDPNVYTASDGKASSKTYSNWPEWSEAQELMQFWAQDSNLLADDYRQSSYEWIAENTASLHV